MIGLFHEITDNYIDRVCALAEKRIGGDTAGRVREFLTAMKDACQPAPQVVKLLNNKRKPYITFRWHNSDVAITESAVFRESIWAFPRFGCDSYPNLSASEAVQHLAPILSQLAKDDTT